MFTLFVVAVFWLEINMFFLISGIPWTLVCDCHGAEICPFLYGLTGDCKASATLATSLIIFSFILEVFLEAILDLRSL